MLRPSEVFVKMMALPLNPFPPISLDNVGLRWYLVPLFHSYETVTDKPAHEINIRVCNHLIKLQLLFTRYWQLPESSYSHGQNLPVFPLIESYRISIKS
jgi:hypothetical protein